MVSGRKGKGSQGGESVKKGGYQPPASVDPGRTVKPSPGAGVAKPKGSSGGGSSTNKPARGGSK